MPSKTSFFNAGLFRKNLSRFWPLYVSVILLGLLVPLTLFLNMNGPYSLLDTTDMLYSILCYASPLIAIGFALPAAITVWQYLHQTKSVGMMHSLPVTRDCLFVTNTLSGLAMMLIPYAVVGFFMLLYFTVRGEISALAVLQTVGACFADALLYFAIATLAAVVAGNSLMAIALYAVWNFLAIGLEAFFTWFATGFVRGVGSNYTGKFEFLSPIVYRMQNVCRTHTYAEHTGELTDVSLTGYAIVWYYALVGLALLGLAFFLNRRRRSESAGDAIAFRALRPVFLYVTAAASALLIGSAAYSILFSDLLDNCGFYCVTRPFPMAVCMVFGALLGYFGAEMILKKSTRVFHKRSFIGFGVVALCSFVLCFALSFDLPHVESRVPDASEIDSVSIGFCGMSADYRADRDAEEIAFLTELHRAIVRDLDTVAVDVNNTGDDDYIDSVWLSYTLKNGEKLSRDYFVRLQTDGTAGGNSDYEAALCRLMTDKSFLRRQMRADDERYAPVGGSLYTMKGDRRYELSRAEAASLTDAVLLDIDAGRATAANFSYMPLDETYAVTVELEFSVANDPADENHTADYWYYELRLSPDMTSTMEAVRALGFLLPGELVTFAEFEDVPASFPAD